MNDGDWARDPGAQASRPRLPRGIWALGFVSMLMDISSEMIHGLLPVFLVSVLGASTATVGLIEGVGEATASISKLFSGWASDRLGKRKVLTVIGYGMAALSKPLFAVAPTSSWVLAARFSDRVGKGIRGAPRDALIGDMAPAELRGAAYGLRQSLDTVGAFAGPLIAVALMALLSDNFRLVFWLAVIPGFAAVAVLVVAVREPAQARPVAEARAPIRRAELGRLGGLFWGVVAVGTILTLARFSEAFLILRAGAVGLPAAYAPLVLVVMNVVYAALAYPMGALSDRVDRRLLLVAGFAVLILADIVLAFAPGIWIVMLGVGLWGLHMGMTQGLLAALVADTAPEALRGTAFGVFNFASGVALLFASL
ncbi:MAG TPA: MFS transporter, partial [Candidatus Cybelea sp.]|nr:MFS transporter [Candidatus Cybelea sp.]